MPNEDDVSERTTSIAAVGLGSLLCTPAPERPRHPRPIETDAIMETWGQLMLCVIGDGPAP